VSLSLRFPTRDRISPHASFGYQRNGDSVLAGDVTTDTSSHLPDSLLIPPVRMPGSRIVSRFLRTSWASPGRCKENCVFYVYRRCRRTHSNIVHSTATINQASIAVGGKVNPVGRLFDHGQCSVPGE